MAHVPSGTVTFLFTDIEGSTRLWGRFSDAMATAVARHDALLRAAIEARGGYVFKTVGDAFCAAFATAAAALAAALDLQRALAAEAWGETGRLRVRTALHAGVAQERDGDYFGPPVNRIARLLSTAYGDQILLSAAARELLRDGLPPEARLRDLGEHRLKDLELPERVFQLVVPDLPADFPPLKSLDRHPHNLPAQATSFVGRERELAAARTLLLRPDVRLLTLTGPGGTGKTRLSLQIAAELLGDFEGAFVVSLAPVADPDLVASAIAQTLGVREEGYRPLADSLAEHIGDEAMLLILDNFEQVLGAAPLVSALLAACPHLKALATSRARLRIAGEHELAVPPLGLPPLGAAPSLPEVAGSEAVALFVERAQAVQPAFALTAATAVAVATICVRLEGLPLAIELAAARSKLFTPQALLTRLSRRLPLLTGGPRDRPARQQTLRDAIAWSYDLLSPAEQALFRHLAIFAGGCTLETAEAVAGSANLDALAGMESLVDKSLLRLEAQADGEPRFSMLDTIREYALERLDESGEAEAIRQAHAACFRELAERAVPELSGPEQASWLDRLETEHDNLREALGWALDQPGETVLRLAGALWGFWLSRGHLKEGQEWLERALASAVDVPPGIRARALDAAGVFAQERGEPDRAAERHEEALALYRELGDRTGAATALDNMGTVAWLRQEYDRASILHAEALGLWREAGNKVGIATSLINIGNVAFLQGDADRARLHYENAASLCRDVGDNRLMALCLGNLATVVRDQNDHQRATALYGESLVIAQDLGDRKSIADLLVGIGSLISSTGRAEDAARLFGAAEALRESTGLASTPVDPLYDDAVASTRSELGAEAFVKAWTQGRELSLDEAIANATAATEGVAEHTKPSSTGR